MNTLFKQDPQTKKNGGWQSLLVNLQEACIVSTGLIQINLRQRRRIRMYAFKYGNGGWESRLVTAFGRHLGVTLDAGLPPPDWQLKL